MCSINRTIPSWARDGCKKTPCLLHYPCKIKKINSLIFCFTISLHKDTHCATRASGMLLKPVLHTALLTCYRPTVLANTSLVTLVFNISAHIFGDLHVCGHAMHSETLSLACVNACVRVCMHKGMHACVRVHVIYVFLVVFFKAIIVICLNNFFSSCIYMFYIELSYSNFIHLHFFH